MRKLSNSELNRITVKDFKATRKLPVVVVLDNVRSLQNIGSVFRTSDAFRVEGIHLCGISATPPHREIHRTALGATESVDWKYFPTTAASAETLRAGGYLIYGVEQTDQSVPLGKFRPPEGRKFALIFGNEIGGIGEEIIPLLDGCLEIPQFGTKHSLNIAVSAGIVLWHIHNLEEYFGNHET